MNIKKILITGGCGFVGSNLSEKLHKSGYKIVTIDNFSRKGSILNYQRIKKIGIKNYKIDISNQNQLKKVSKFDLIIHCCAETSVEVSKNNINKFFNTNLIGTLNILEKCKRDKSDIIFLSSSRVYSLSSLNKIIHKRYIDKEIKIRKTIDVKFDTLKPKTFYGYSKFASEHLIKEYCYLNKTKYIINRCGVISGPWQFGKTDQGFVSLWVWKFINRGIISYIGFGGHGHQVRDILHVDDLSDLIFLQIKKISVINNITLSVGGGLKNSISLFKLTDICQKIIGNKVNIKKISRTSNYDIPYFVSSIKQIREIYGWKPKKKISEIVRDIFLWQKNNKKELKKYF